MLPAAVVAAHWCLPPAVAPGGGLLEHGSLEDLVSEPAPMESRSAMVFAVRIGMALGEIAPAAISTALTATTDGAMVDLANRAVEALGRWMSAISRSTGASAQALALLGAHEPQFVVGDHDIGLVLRQDGQLWIDLGAIVAEMPDELVALVHDAVSTLSGLEFGVALDSLRFSDTELDFLLYEARILNDEGLLDNPEGAWHRVRDSDDFEVSHYYIEGAGAGCDVEQMTELLARMSAYLEDAEKPWRKHVHDLELLPLSASIIRRAWRWRCERSPLYESPWCRWAVSIARDARRAVRLGANPPSFSEIERFLEEDGEPLALAVLFGFGEPYAEYLANAVLSNRLQTGEVLQMGWSAQMEAPERTLAQMRCYARAVGWALKAHDLGADVYA